MTYVVHTNALWQKEKRWARMYQVSSSVITAVGQQCRLPRVKNDCLMENYPKNTKTGYVQQILLILRVENAMDF